MRVLVLGGTGQIGAPIVTTLMDRGHEVLALARSAGSAVRLQATGAEVLRGDIRDPGGWLDAVDQVDAVIHAASDFAADMGEVDRGLVDALLGRLGMPGRRRRLVYTGGCWLFGATGDRVATEDDPFDPLPAFAWMVRHLRRVLAAPGFDGMVVHPAMVYERDGGVFHRFADDARTLGRIRVVGGEAVRWPLVHRQDLAELYALALERGIAGRAYNGAAVEGVPVGRIARAMALRLGLPEAPLVRSEAEVAAELGDWARGYALDQQMSGARARTELDWRPRWLAPVAELG